MWAGGFEIDWLPVRMKTSSRSPVTTQQWLLFALLLISVWINYIDRGNLGVAAPMLQQELGLSDANLGFLLSCFFWTYSGCLFFVGWLVDRYDVTRVYAIGYLIWSLATGLTGFASSYPTLLSLRLMLGAGESVAYPAYSKIVARTFPETQRGLANALIDACTKCGPAVGTLVGGLAMHLYGWRVFFMVLGLGSLLWLVPWLLFMPRSKGSVAGPADAPHLSEILRQRSAWGTFIGLFCGNYAWYFLLTWLPTYLVKGRGFTQEEMATIGSLPFFTLAASATFFGWLSDRMIARGASPTRVRKSFCALGLSSSTVMLGAALTANHTLAMTLLIVGCFLFGLYTSNLWAITQRLAGPSAAGKWTGFQNGIGNFGGVASPWLTGWLVQETHSYVWPFIVTCFALVIGAVFFGVVVQQVEPIQWRTGKREELAPLPQSA